MRVSPDHQPSLTIISKYASVPNEGLLTKAFYLGKYLARRGVDVTLVVSTHNHTGTTAGKPRVRFVDGVKVVALKTPAYGSSNGKARIWSWFVFEIKAFLFLIKNKRRDIYLASSPSLLTGLTARLVARFKHSKYIFDVRDIWPLSFTEDPSIRTDGIGYRFMAWIEKIVTKDAAWSMSSIPRLDIYNSEVLGITKPFIFFPICVDEDVIPKENAPDFSDVRDGSRLVVGYSGNIGVSNNLDPLIDAIEKLRDDCRFLFKIVGKGAMLNKYKARVSGFDNVVFFDAVPRDEIWSFGSSIDVGYISTHNSKLWLYGQSLHKLVDYMGSGIPVIMSYPIDGYRTMLNEAGCGTFVPANSSDFLIDALESYSLMTGSELKNIGEKGRDWIKKHRSYERHVAEFYRRIFDPKN